KIPRGKSQEGQAGGVEAAARPPCLGLGRADPRTQSTYEIRGPFFPVALSGGGDRMDVTQLPFNRLLGLESAAPDSGLLVSLPDGPHYTNHRGTVHAGALLAVAEAGSGAFLVRHLGSGPGYVPVVRRLEAKFRKPARGRVSARCAVPAEEVGRW